MVVIIYLFCLFHYEFIVAHKENIEKLETEAKEKHDKEWEGKNVPALKKSTNMIAQIYEFHIHVFW